MRRATFALLCATLSVSGQSPLPIRFADAQYTAAVTSDIVYGANQNPWTYTWDTLKLDLWLPQGDNFPRRPVFIYVHGGQYFYGDKTDGPPRLVLDWFVSRGWCGISINYRLAPTWNHGGLAPGAVSEDAKAAVRWVRKNASTYGLDADRIAMGGDSVGAVTALMCGYSQWDGNSGNPGYSSRIQCAVDFWGQGVYTVADPACAVMVVHGDADTVIPFTEALRLKNEATQFKVPCEWTPLSGAGHMPWDRWDLFKFQLLRFCYDALALEELAGLDVRMFPNNQLVYDLAGAPGDQVFLLASALQTTTWLPGLGTTYIDPYAFVVLGGATLPGAAVPVSTQIFLQVPTGLTGTIYAQTLYTRYGYPHRLSNGMRAIY